VRAVSQLARIHFVRQDEPRGLGHAVGMARYHVGDEPFAVLLPDDLMAEGSTLLSDMIAACETTGGSVVALKRFPADQISAYGVIDPAGGPTSDGYIPIRSMVEKPPATEAPSDLAIVGRYVLTPAVFDRIAALQPGAGGELQLTDALLGLCQIEPFHGVVFEAGRYDTGNKLDWLRATVEVALQHEELGKPFRDVLAEIVHRQGIG
jgi:UTP--glucose-1-phosphate uridylyltransferase